MKNGGARPGSGRPKGSLNESTKEKRKVAEAFEHRVRKNADRLFNAQFRLAEGVAYVYRVDEVGEGKSKRKEHVIVTSPTEIKEFLDTCEPNGANGGGEVNGKYYYISTEKPHPQAIDSLLDRAMGKAVQRTELTGKDGEAIEIADGTSVDLKKLSTEQLRAFRDLLSIATVPLGDRDGTSDALPN